MKYILFALLLIWGNQTMSCSCSEQLEFKSKEDLNRYSFIALVNIDSIFQSKAEKLSSFDIFYEARISILELFKGDKIETILVNGGIRKLGLSMTSCDIGIDKNQKWVLFGYEDKNGLLRTGYCTFSKMYANSDGERDWQNERGIKEIKTLQHIYSHSTDDTNKKLEGLVKTYYQNGRIEIQANFDRGFLQGKKTIYYFNEQPMIEEEYENGLKSGSSMWYYKDGSIKRRFRYKDGHPIDTCYFYRITTGQVECERIFNENGEVLKNSIYAYSGKLKSISEVIEQSNELKNISYYPSGTKRSLSISNSKDFKDIKKVEYFESGKREREWTYFPSDSLRKFEFKQWDKEGQLINNYILLENREKIERM